MDFQPSTHPSANLALSLSRPLCSATIAARTVSQGDRMPPICNTAKTRRAPVSSIGLVHAKARGAFQVEDVDDALPDELALERLADGDGLGEGGAAGAHGLHSVAQSVEPSAFHSRYHQYCSLSCSSPSSRRYAEPQERQIMTWSRRVVVPLSPVRYPSGYGVRQPLEGFMGAVQVQLPDHIKAAIDRQVAEGRVSSESEFLVEAARRYAEDLELEDAITTEAKAGIADAEAGRSVTIATSDDAEALHERTMARLRERLAADRA